jgi:hypothetical protein
METMMSAHKNVYMALAAAQSAMAPVVKTAINPAFKGEGKPKGTAYADLADVVQAVSPALTGNGIAFTHYTMREDGRDLMVTALVHGESDTRVECAIPLLLGKQDMQSYKSATTYAKRIGLESVTGVAPDDDDGAAANRNPVVDRRCINADQFTDLRNLIEKSGSDEARMLAFFKLETLEEMPVEKYGAAVSMLRRKIADNAAPEPVDA